MPLLGPPRITQDITTAEGTRAAVAALLKYQQDTYNVMRVIVYRNDLMTALAPLTQTISNPPTQAEVQQIQISVNTIIGIWKQLVAT